MKKRWNISTIEFMAIIELISIPLLFYLFQNNVYGFWMILVYLDFMQLYLLDMRELMVVLQESKYRDLLKRYKVYSFGLSLCYLMIAFKDSSLCMILISNDLILLILNPFVKKNIKIKRKK